jgi:trehalose 6-phosphate synthase/phosphatase
MTVYSTRTHGAFVQTKGSSILFNFGDSDPEFGAMQGKELQTTLQHVLAGFPVEIRTGKGYVEACHQDVNKGAMAEHMINLLQGDGQEVRQHTRTSTHVVSSLTPLSPLQVDFVLCAGDDSTDELMFAALNNRLGKKSNKLFTVTIGRKPSEASRYLDDHNEVVALLELLCSIGFRAPGTTLGGGMGGGGMKRTGGAMGRGMQGMSSSFSNLASLA